jgi:hypothetical protein
MYDTYTNVNDLKNRLRDAIRTAEAELEKLEREPMWLHNWLRTEPNLDEGFVVVTFKKRFYQGGKWYGYAATYTPDTDKWYTTGPKSPKGFTWEELVKWMFYDASKNVYERTLIQGMRVHNSETGGSRYFG